MEGLADPLMRNVLTALGGYDWGICEFVRVTESDEFIGKLQACTDRDQMWQLLEETDDPWG